MLFPQHSPFFQSKRILITGGAGFIGSHLANELAALGAHVRVLDDLSSGLESNLDSSSGRIELVRASLLDQASVTSACVACRRKPFNDKNTPVASRAARLLPSTKGWLRAMPKP